VTPPFRTLAYRRRDALQLSALPLVFLPHPMMTRTAEEIEAIADQVADEVARVFLEEPVTEARVPA